ncbi:peptidoglycan-binding protein [Microbacterium sp. NEAU-LLC]|uniref:Peptidoglycan-binding protein n=1 Tax=Microbacterium helvum TaxID=2773713 RepID=A0ABR8NHA7_9MICO|nr:peptidoglycan-binding protein [Microbacterium helvum]
MRVRSVKWWAVTAGGAIGVVILGFGLGGCASEGSPVDRAETRVAAKQKALTQAEQDAANAANAFCDASKDYILALDRYGDVLHDTAPTVGDVRAAGADLVEPREDAFDGAEAAIAARQQVAVAQAELADAQAALEQAKAGPSATPAAVATPQPTPTAVVPEADVQRVEQAESDFADAQGAITDDTPLAAASEQFNSAVVALEFSWLRLYADAGCIAEDQVLQAQQAVSAYTSALQQDLADAGYYAGAVDGVYGPETVAAIEALQQANGLPATGTVDDATAAALEADLAALGGAAAQESIASTAAVQQTLALLGFWDGPVDGVWTPELTDAVVELQTELGVEPTGAVDAATVSALEMALEELTQPAPDEPTPTPIDSSEG